MKLKPNLLLLSGALSVALCASADSLEKIEGLATGFSPDASLIVGNDALYGDASFTSFLYKNTDGAENEKMQWLTDGTNYFGSHLDGGKFTAVNNDGVIVGTIRNPDMRLEPYVGPYNNDVTTLNFSDDEEGEAISSAAVWRNGKLYVLGCGPYTIEYFSDVTDGSAATGVSADGNTVFGHIISNWMPIEACVWEYDETTDKYVYRALAMPDEGMISSMVANSAAGFPAIGSVSITLNHQPFMYPALWTSPDDFVFVDMPEIGNAEGFYATAISEDGKKVSLCINSFSHPGLYVYSVEDNTMEEVTLPSGTTQASAVAMDNKGNMILKVQDSNWNTRLCYFDNKSGSVVGFDEYLASTSDFSFDGNRVVAMSGDGKNILYANDNTADSYLLAMDNPQMSLCAAPEIVSLYHTSPTALEVRFEGIAIVPDDCVLTGYVVYVDGNEVKTVEATEVGGEYFVQTDGQAGVNHSAYVCTRYTSGGEENVSNGSTVATDFVSEDVSLLSFVDFDDATDDKLGNFYWPGDTWNAKSNYGVPGEYINWHLTANDFENRTPFVNVVAASTEPWSCLYVSHFMDATEARKFFLDFRYLIRLVNTADQELDTDWLDVEASTDGRNWKTVASINAAQSSPYVWHTCHVDLGEDYAGTVFQLRFNAHGQGKGQLIWAVDDIAIDDDLYGAAPTGLRYTADETSMKLMWHSALGMHDLSHLDNSSILWDYNVGSEGMPLIGAIELTANQIKPFEGEYIKAVSTFLFDDPSLEQATPTKAEAIVYVDGKEVARAQFDSEFNTVEQSVAWLDTPVAIESGKSYRIGIRISDYDAEQAPMYYQAALTSVPGITDLYSEDEGLTWHKASDIVVSEVNTEGYCVWPIRAYISADADEVPGTSEVIFYDVFRDGQKVNSGNIYEPHPWLTVEAPYEGKYTVQAHYKGGNVSPMSEEIEVKYTSGLEQIVFTLGVTTGKGTITISGDCQGATLYDMSGHVVAATSGNTFSGLASGVYILTANTANGTETFKVAVK